MGLSTFGREEEHLPGWCPVCEILVGSQAACLHGLSLRAGHLECPYMSELHCKTTLVFSQQNSSPSLSKSAFCEHGIFLFENMANFCLYPPWFLLALYTLTVMKVFNTCVHVSGDWSNLHMKHWRKCSWGQRSKWVYKPWILWTL